jgi:hypothetical protein
MMRELKTICIGALYVVPCFVLLVLASTILGPIGIMAIIIAIFLVVLCWFVGSITNASNIRVKR